MKKFNLKTVLALFSMCAIQICSAQHVITFHKDSLANRINQLANKEISVGKIKVDTLIDNDKQVDIYLNTNFAYYPFRKESVQQFNRIAKDYLNEINMPFTKINLWTDGKQIEQLIPNLYKNKKDQDKSFTNRVTTPLVSNKSIKYSTNKGLTNKHLAIWQSHGWYFEPKLDRWEWQRARIFQTVEDLYTQSYVLPYLVPMLENAGAIVLLPRERDINKQEVIVDNDQSASSIYIENNGDLKWEAGKHSGFAHNRTFYVDNQNPFTEGTYRQVETIKKGKESVISWLPNIPQKGDYAVYISYKTIKNSTTNARYTVHHGSQKTEFHVNQQMGGGTWIYLGHFNFDQGINDNFKITLSNLSNKKGEVVTADAIKFGGGYGNIARKVSEVGTMENAKSSESRQADVTSNPKATMDYEYQISQYPRFTEAARYWMQWAGIPDSIYSPSKGVNDYTDDYQARGSWVNYISGGSSANPNEDGLNIPIDLAFAFHSDAGTTFNDSIIGTLGIYRSQSHNGKLANGASRNLARDLTDLVQTQIVDDIRTLYNPNWTRRGMWDKAYSEASTPKVPTMLLELLSHQNFADMQYGLDPKFRFTVSRAIYKGILKYISSQYNFNYVVQPLPVESMLLELNKNNQAQLSWKAVEDKLEPTAKPTSYMVYMKIGNGQFDQGQIVKGNTFITDVPIGVTCSFKVTALNDGGESFPSETLAIGIANNSKGQVLVINGFTRTNAPDDFDFRTDSIAGFLDDSDHGVPYLRDISYIGKMKEFRRTIPWMDDDASGFGDSYGTHETEIIAGNTFDYPAVHGESILNAGYSFVSSSKQAIEQGSVEMTKYKLVDYILGKEKQVKTGNGKDGKLLFKTFTNEMQKAITEFTQNGGSIFVSGSYVATDLWDNPLIEKSENDIKFAQEVLQYKWRVGKAAIMGGLKEVNNPYVKGKDAYHYQHELSEDSYIVESPDAIEPASVKGYTTLRYNENNLSAGVAYRGKYRTYIMGVPFESINNSEARNLLMKKVLDFLNQAN